MRTSFVRRSFPGEFAGASLKRGASRAPPGAHEESVPRRIRRGLIEAALGRVGTMTAAGSFPGEFAGASLKRGSARGEAAVGRGRSPANSPGPH